MRVRCRAVVAAILEFVVLNKPRVNVGDCLLRGTRGRDLCPRDLVDAMTGRGADLMMATRITARPDSLSAVAMRAFSQMAAAGDVMVPADRGLAVSEPWLFTR